jgi:hypothetical protein
MTLAFIASQNSLPGKSKKTKPILVVISAWSTAPEHNSALSGEIKSLTAQEQKSSRHDHPANLAVLRISCVLLLASIKNPPLLLLAAHASSRDVLSGEIPSQP